MSFNWNNFPYEEIEVKDLTTSDYTSKAKSISMYNPNKERIEEVSVVSNDYLLASNMQVKNMQDEFVSKTNIPFNESKVFFNGKTFARFMKTNQFTTSVNVGDDIALGMFAMNSYDGSVKLHFGLYAERLVCTNGMISKTFFMQHHFKHSKENMTWADQLNNAYRTLYEINAEKSLQEFTNGLKQLTQRKCTVETLQKLRATEFGQLPITTWGKVVDRFLFSEEETVYGAYNAVTNILWHNQSPSIQDIKMNRNITDLLMSTVAA